MSRSFSLFHPPIPSPSSTEQLEDVHAPFVFLILLICFNDCIDYYLVQKNKIGKKNVTLDPRHETLDKKIDSTMGYRPGFVPTCRHWQGADPKNSESRWPGNMPEFYKYNFQTSKEKGLAIAASAHPKSALGQSLSVARSLPGDSAL